MNLKVQHRRADLLQHGSRPGRAGHLLVLLRPGAVVLRREEARLSGFAAAQPQLVEKGQNFDFYLFVFTAGNSKNVLEKTYDPKRDGSSR